MIRTSIRRGLTLIELTVVLLILAAVAGIIIPRLTGYFVRAHGAAGASNIGETVKAIGLYEVNNAGAVPDNWDALTDNSTVGANVITGIGIDGGDIVAVTVTDGGEAALFNAGIVNLLHFGNDGAGAYDGDNATYDPYDGGATNTGITTTQTTATIIDGTSSGLAGLTLGGIGALGLQGVQGDYVVLGLGSQNTLIGNGIVDAPVHFPEDNVIPQEQYSRFVAVFRISDDGGTTYFERAKLSTVAAVHGGDVAGLGDHTAEYFEGAEQAAGN